jgi:hypothetical protein
VKEVERLGYVFDHRNSKGADYFVHEDTGCELKLIPGFDERRARSVLEVARHQIGLPTKDNKRNPQQIRERNAIEHANAARELEAIRARRGALTGADERRVREVEEAFLRADRKFRYWDRLMRSAA